MNTMTGCATHHFKNNSPIEYEFNITEEFEPYSNLIIILDASASMGEFYKKELKIKAATQLLEKMNDQMMSLKVPFQLSFITIGRTLWPLQMKTDIVIPLRKYDRNSLKEAIQKIRWTGGKTPLASTIASLYDLLSKTSEPSALLVISDAEDLQNSPVFSAESLIMRFKDRLCIYSIQVGNRPSGKWTLEKMSALSECGLYKSIDDLTNDLSIEQFVKKMIYMGKEPTSTPMNKGNQKRFSPTKTRMETWDEYIRQ